MTALCRVDDIADPGAKGFSIGSGENRRDIFVVRAQGRIYGFVNSCPHIGTPLDFLPDRFLTQDGAQILCSTHGARFEIATGRCVAGPCPGRFLPPVPVKVDKGLIYLQE